LGGGFGHSPVKGEFNAQKEDVVLFRFGVICDLVGTLRPEHGDAEKLIHSKSEQVWKIPYSKTGYIHRQGKPHREDLAAIFNLPGLPSFRTQQCLLKMKDELKSSVTLLTVTQLSKMKYRCIPDF
jgi:hypothetical protein